MKDKKILITGGGTGGHLYPALAVIEYIRKHYPGTSITFLGSRKGSGRVLITKLGIEFHEVRARGLTGGGNIFKKAAVYLMFLLELVPGFFQSLAVLRKKNIDIVLGMGGYICAPVLLAAILLRKRFVLHEQNYIPGRLNRLFSGHARYFFTSFEDTKKYLDIDKKSVIFSGNPVRESIRMTGVLKPEYRSWGLSEDKFTITAFGGSQGARRINESVLELGRIKDAGNDMQVLLITGTRFYDVVTGWMEKMDLQSNVDIKVFPYIDDIEKVYSITDLVIARAGANTVFETVAAKIPSLAAPPKV